GVLRRGTRFRHEDGSPALVIDHAPVIAHCLRIETEDALGAYTIPGRGRVGVEINVGRQTEDLTLRDVLIPELYAICPLRRGLVPGAGAGIVDRDDDADGMVNVLLQQIANGHPKGDPGNASRHHPGLLSCDRVCTPPPRVSAHVGRITTPGDLPLRHAPAQAVRGHAAGALPQPTLPHLVSVAPIDDGLVVRPTLRHESVGVGHRHRIELLLQQVARRSGIARGDNPDRGRFAGTMYTGISLKAFVCEACKAITSVCTSIAELGSMGASSARGCVCQAVVLKSMPGCCTK